MDEGIDQTRPLRESDGEADGPLDGRRVGRYVVLKPIGRGGGGQVFAAFDTVLDRRVALKELWERPGSTQNVIREGRLLARLSHPSIVTIHDIAFADDGRTYLAMELVDGESFEAWTERGRSTPQGRSAIRRALVDICAGIAAAHEGAVVHGDIKPSNVLVDVGGRARVTDFGVARIVDRHRRDLGEPDLETPWSSVGTPAYMAPEQHEGRPADERSDQYSFCLTAWQALTGAYPLELDPKEREAAVTFTGTQDVTGPLTSLAERLAQAKLAWRPPASAPGIPPGWAKILARGLDPDPAQRWPTMHELHRRLAARRRRRWPLVTAGALAVLGATGWAWAWSLGRRCQGATAALGSVWDETARSRVEAAIEATGADYAQGVWTHVADDLDAYARRWVEAHGEACRATTIRGEQPPEVMSHRMACLMRARRDLTAAVEVLAEIDADGLARAHRVSGGLPPIDRCLEPTAPDGTTDDDDPAAAAPIREAIARSKALRAAGRAPEARETMDTARAEAEATGFPPVMVAARVEHGIVLERVGEFEAARRAFEEAVTLGTKIGAWERTLRAHRGLLYVLGTRLHRVKEAAIYLPTIEGLVERVGNNPLDRADFVSDQALIAYENADYESSVELERKALELYREALGERSLPTMWARRRVANTLRSLSRLEEAESDFRAIVELQTQWLGPDHPEVHETRCDLAQVLYRRGAYAEAEAELRAALPVQEELLGRAHPVLLGYRATLAEALVAQDRTDEAEREFRAALEAMGDGPGPEAELRNGLGNLLENAGRLEEAAEQHRRAAEVFSQTLGPDHPNVAISKHNLANVLSSMGRYEESERLNAEALAAVSASLGPAHPQVGMLRMNIGRDFKNRKRYADARREIEAALQILVTALGDDHPAVVEGRALLGRLEAEARGDAE